MFPSLYKSATLVAFNFPVDVLATRHSRLQFAGWCENWLGRCFKSIPHNCGCGWAAVHHIPRVPCFVSHLGKSVMSLHLFHSKKQRHTKLKKTLTLTEHRIYHACLFWTWKKLKWHWFILIHHSSQWPCGPQMQPANFCHFARKIRRFDMVWSHVWSWSFVREKVNSTFWTTQASGLQKRQHCLFEGWLNQFSFVM